MKNLTSIYSLATVCFASLLLWSCGAADGKISGTEYMPDMTHSIAYEANLNSYYDHNTWGGEEDYAKYAGPHKPVVGTVARGFLPTAYQNLEDFRASSSSEESHAVLQEKVRKLMMADASLVNPIRPTSAKELARVLIDGKTLYTVACSVCHGEEVDGNGILFDGGDGKYTAKPANLVSDEFTASLDGRYLNAILHGKGMMQQHRDKLTPIERWKVIHYIRSVQAENSGTEYDPAGNVNIAPTETQEEAGDNESHDDDHDK
jgi:mono/diheme cytochrome c family protein